MTDPVPPAAENSNQTNQMESRRTGILRQAFKWLGLGILTLVMLLLLFWAALAVYFADTHNGPRRVGATIFVLFCIALIFVRPARRRLLAATLLFLAVLGWYFTRQPSNTRDWSPDVANVPYGVIEGDRLTLHNVRNFDYRSETDFTPNWETRTYDLSKLDRVDMMLVYWGSKAIAHVMVSFEFTDGQHLAVSIETRKEKGETYSAVEGFFRQFELYYVFADELDVVRLRTNYRKEQVYLYRTNLTPAQARASLLSYIKAANALKDKPQWYNALTDNCATSVLPHARDAGLQGKWSMDIVMSGYAARQGYRNGHLDTSIPFEQLEAQALVNDRALAASKENFSKAIRAGMK